jgi:hypothetical protein
MRIARRAWSAHPRVVADLIGSGKKDFRKLCGQCPNLRTAVRAAPLCRIIARDTPALSRRTTLVAPFIPR